MNTLGYLCSEYPALSHTFISREIVILEREGFKILTAAINPVSHPEKLGINERARVASTYYVKNTPLWEIAMMSFRYFFLFPAFLPVLFYCLRHTWFAGPRNFSKSAGYFIQAILLHSWAKKNGIAHIHVHFPNPAATVALVACRFPGLEFSLSVHGPDEFYNIDSYNLREKVQAAVFVRCIGYFCRSQLMLFTPPRQWTKFHIVRCGLFQDEFLPRSEKKGLLKNILCVGRLCSNKGQFILLQAAEILVAKNIDFHILFLGGGEDQGMIEQEIGLKGLTDFVTLAGPVSHDRVKAELTKTDIFILPSFAEGIPVALMEAMAAGIPVVSTNIAGIPELIEHGKDGFLTQASNADQLAEIIEAMLNGKIDLESIRDNAVKKIQTQFDVYKNTRELGAIFTTL